MIQTEQKVCTKVNQKMSDLSHKSHTVITLKNANKLYLDHTSMTTHGAVKKQHLNTCSYENIKKSNKQIN